MRQTSQEWVQWIEARRNRRHGLEHFQQYMASIGNPQTSFLSIHVAGTNGKGSTTNYLRAILQTSYQKVGTFTSPYLVTHFDRIRINNVDMDEDSFLAFVNKYHKSWEDWDLGMFEIDMMLACVYFKQQHVDFAIFEVGLGGRLDATNILHPLVSVITNIGLDHTEILGHTHSLIAEEKAGIIKEGADVITAEEREDCLAVFQQHANACQVDLHRIKDITHICLQYPLSFQYRALEVTLASNASYQMKNAALAIETILQLRSKDMVEVTTSDMLEAIASTQWQGRFEIMQQDPLVIIDGAHNPDGIQALCDSLTGYDHLCVLFSALQDKNFENMLDQLEDITDDITITHFENARSFDLSTLKKRSSVTIIPDYKEAIEVMLKKGKTVVITGSLYFISEVRKYFKG